MIKAIIILISYIFITGCSSSPSSNVSSDGSKIKTSITTEEESSVTDDDIIFFDSEIFDAKLSLALRSNKDEVVIRMLEPFSVNQIPERFDKWIFSVKNYGGEVELKPEIRTRFFGVIIGLAIEAYNLAKEVLIYRTASNYNLVVYYTQGKGTIPRAVFVKKTNNQKK